MYSPLEWQLHPNFTLGWLTKTFTLGMQLSSSKLYPPVAYKKFAPLQ